MNTTTIMNFPMRLFMVDRLSMAVPPFLVAGWQRLWGSSLETTLRFLPVACCLLLLGTSAQAQSAEDIFPPKPEPAVYVHDYAGWLSQGQKSALEQKLRGYWDSTTTQIVVMIRPDIGDYDKSSYAFELGTRWGIGRKDKNNGVVMLIKSTPPDRGIFIATGYGTEGALPDITAGRIIRNTMAPFFRQQQYYEGINAGVDDIIGALAGEFKDDEAKDEGGGAVILIALAFFILIFIFIAWRLRKRGTWYSNKSRGNRGPLDGGGLGGFGGWWIGGGGGWGGGSGGGGGWGDGGSFGGGDFGGGGAGGDW